MDDRHFNLPVPDRAPAVRAFLRSGDHVDDSLRGAMCTAVRPALRVAPPGTARARLLGSAKYAGTDMTGKTSGTGPETNGTRERLGKSAAPTTEPTQCDFCGKPLGANRFSLADKAYCSPRFHAQFWTPSEVSRVRPVDFRLDMEGEVEAGPKSSPLAPRDQGLRSVNA